MTDRMKIPNIRQIYNGNYDVRLNCCGRFRYIGTYSTLELAIAMRDAAKLKATAELAEHRKGKWLDRIRKKLNEQKP